MLLRYTRKGNPCRVQVHFMFSSYFISYIDGRGHEQSEIIILLTTIVVDYLCIEELEINHRLGT